MKGRTGESVFSRGNRAFMNMYSYKLCRLVVVTGEIFAVSSEGYVMISL